MACTEPLSAWRTADGSVVLREPVARKAGTIRLAVPCGRCLGCRLAAARAWAVRCQLELKQHRRACWVTLTYDDAHVPPTLHKRHFQAWLKRLRHHAKRRVRYFACGEYGDQFGRPHYHAILFGLDLRDAWMVAETWGKGRVSVDPLTPAAVTYVCGYQLKKASSARRERVLGGRVPYHYPGPCTAETFLDRSTGEVYRLAVIHEPPFLLMSRRPGIGADAKAKFARMWRSSVIHNGQEVPVPRYLHQAWKDQATPEQLLELEREKLQRMPATLAENIEKERHRAASAVIHSRRVRDTLLRRKS